MFAISLLCPSYDTTVKDIKKSEIDVNVPELFRLF